MYSTSIFLYVHDVFDCFLETSGVHGTFLNGVWHFLGTSISTPLSIYDLCTCDKIFSIKIALFTCLRYEKVIHILFCKVLNVILKASITLSIWLKSIRSITFYQ